MVPVSQIWAESLDALQRIRILSVVFASFHNIPAVYPWSAYLRTCGSISGQPYALAARYIMMMSVRLTAILGRL